MCSPSTSRCCMEANKYCPTIYFEFGDYFVGEFDVYVNETSKYTRHAINRVKYVYDYFQEPVFDFVHKICVNFGNFLQSYSDVKIIPLKYSDDMENVSTVLRARTATKVAFTSQLFHSCIVRGRNLTFFLEPDQMVSETLVAYELIDPLEVVEEPEVEEFFNKSACVHRAFSRDLNITNFPAVDLYVQQAWAWWTGAPYQQVYCLATDAESECVPYTTPFFLKSDDPHRIVKLSKSHIACAKLQTLEGGQLQTCDGNGTYRHVVIEVGYNASWNDMDWLLTPILYTGTCLQLKTKGERRVTLHCESYDPAFQFRPNITIDVSDKITTSGEAIHLRSAQICTPSIEIVPVELLGKEDVGLKNYCRLRKSSKTGVLKRETQYLVPGMSKKCLSILFMEDFINFLVLSVCILMICSCSYSLFMFAFKRCQERRRKEEESGSAKEVELATVRAQGGQDTGRKIVSGADIPVQNQQTIFLTQPLPNAPTRQCSPDGEVHDDDETNSLAEAVVAVTRSDVIIESVILGSAAILVVLILAYIYKTIAFSLCASVPFVLFMLHRVHQLMRVSRHHVFQQPRRKRDGYVIFCEVAMGIINFFVYYIGLCLQYADFREVLRYLKIRVEELTFKRLGFLGVIARSYMGFLDVFKQKLESNISILILPVVLFAVFNINQLAFRNPRFQALVNIQRGRRVNWIGFLAKQVFVLYGHAQCVISMLIFLVLERFTFRNAEDEYSSNIVQYLEIVIRIILACYFYTLTRHNMIEQLYSCVAKTVAKVFSNLKIAAFNFLSVFFLLSQKQLRKKTGWALLGVLLYLFLVVADAWVCFIYPALLMSKEYENPLYFFLQLIGVIPPVQYLRNSVKIAIYRFNGDLKTAIRMIMNYVQQTFGFLMICQFLNNQIYLDMFGPLLFTVILCFSIWIPIANFKTLTQLNHAKKMEVARDCQASDFIQSFFRHHVESMQKNAAMQSAFDQIETNYHGDVMWFSNYLADFILQGYFYLPGLGRFFAVIVPFFQQPNLMSDGLFHGWFPFLFNLAAAAAFILHLVLLIFGHGYTHLAPLILNYCLIAVVTQAAVSDFVAPEYRHNWQDSLNYMCRPRNSCRKPRKREVEMKEAGNQK